MSNEDISQRMSTLTHEFKVRVRFSEIDALKMVWHGSYVTYLEDAREAFGIKYGIGYMTIFNNGYFAPVYDLHIHYRHTAGLNDELLVKITYIPKPGGKLCFEYEIRNVETGDLLLTATSVQLFTTVDGEFDPQPQWFEDWKETIINA